MSFDLDKAVAETKRLKTYRAVELWKAGAPICNISTCVLNAVYTIDDLPFCGKHAGKEAILALLATKKEYDL